MKLFILLLSFVCFINSLKAQTQTGELFVACDGSSDTSDSIEIGTTTFDTQLVIEGVFNSVGGECPLVGTASLQVRIDANGYYFDENGQEITVFLGSTGWVSSSTEEPIVSGSIPAGVRIVISASIQVAAGDHVNSSYSITPTFESLTYTADAEPNNDYTEAINTSEGIFYEGHTAMGISTPQNIENYHDYYKLVVPENGQLTIFTNSDNFVQGNYDTSLMAFKSNPDGTTFPNDGRYILTQNSTSNGTSGQFITNIFCVREGDIIYLRFTGTGSSYRFVWNITEPSGYEDVEPNNEFGNAISILDGEIKTGNLGNGIGLGLAAGTTTEDLDDWYSFTTDASGDINISLSSTIPLSTLQPNFYKEDDNGNLVNVAINGNQDIGYSAPCSSEGIYYINLKTSSNANDFTQSLGGCEDCCTTYALSVNYSTSANFESDSEPNNSYSEAQYVAPNIDHEGQIGYYNTNNIDNIDRYELITDYNGSLSVNFTNPMPENSVSLQYFSGSTYSLIGNINTNSNNEITSISYECAAEAESYILNFVTTVCLAYQFNYTNTFNTTNNELESNDTITTAQLFNESDAVYGQVGYGQPGFTDEADVFEISVTESSPLKINLLLDDDTQLKFFQNGNLIAAVTQDANSGTIEEFVYNNIDANFSYHLQVVNNTGCGNYELLGWSQGYFANNDAEPNNSQAEATTIIFDQFYGGQLSYVNSLADSQDFYSFSLTQQDDVQFILNAFEGLVNAASLTLYENAGNQVFQLNHDGVNSSRTSNITTLGAGSYYFIISGTNESGSYQFSVTPQSTLSIDRNIRNELFSVYPNPAQDKINLSFVDTIDKVIYSIYDVTGKLVDESLLEGQDPEINISTLHDGIYFIKISTKDTSSIKRFVKQ